MAFSLTDQKRITILSLMGIDKSDATLEEKYEEATKMLAIFEADGFFDSGNSGSRSSGRTSRSGGRASSSRSGNRGNNSRSKGGNPNWRNDPSTEAQINRAIDLGALEDGYSEEDLEGMTKGEVSDLIENLNR